MKINWLQIALVLSFGFVFLPVSEAQTRFQESDALEVDQDSNVGLEYTNDLVSYRWPESWNTEWDSALMGYQVTTGSLNLTRFLFEERIKLDPIPRAKVSFAFFQSRFEDYSEKNLAREARLGIEALPWLRVVVLGDGGSDKEYGDVGLGLRLFESESGYHELNYWSIDHYYNEKTKQDDSRRTDLLRHWTFRSVGQWGEDLIKWNFMLNIAPKLKWLRPQNEVYTYSYTDAEAKLDFAVQDGQRLTVKAAGHRKTEGFKSSATNSRSLDFERVKKFATISFQQELDNQVQDEYSVDFVERISTWNDTRVIAPGSNWSNPWSSDPFPNKSYRLELGASWLREIPIDPKYSFRWGAVNHLVRLKEDSWDRKNLESKIVTAFYWKNQEKALQSKFGLNATWDIDQLASDFPYRTRPFRPWGGGNIQASILY
jgi:hypothetical protein